jgi:hypothetical protein
MKLSPNQSHYALGVLMSQGKIRQAHVEKALRGREDEIRSLRERLAALEQVSPASPGRSRRRRRGRAAARKAPVRRGIKMSPRVRALRQLQGKYMGYVRRLKPADKARVRSVREKQDIEAAIKLAKSLGAKA